MKPTIFIAAIAAFILLLQSCTSTRRFGTTVEPDEKNPCQINIIIQVAVQGTDEDVRSVRSALEECFNKECFIPCEANKEEGCKTKIKTVVKAFGELKEDEKDAFHYVNFIPDDGQPSNADIGTPNGKPVSGTWRRGASANTICHEVLHFCGLEDKYCARIFDPVTNKVVTERSCVPPPDPGSGSCCTPSIHATRCTWQCDGHDHDIMGAAWAELSCENILDVVKKAGIDKCPPECCASDSTFSRPLDETYLLPGYYHFGDKNQKFGTFGVSIGGTKYIGKSIGVSLEGGFYTHTDKQDDLKQRYNLMHVTAGVTHNTGGILKGGRGPSVTSHIMAGVSRYSQKTTFGNLSASDDATSLHFNVGAALNFRLNKAWTFRALQVDYAPTFFYDATQHNYRVSTGIVYSLER